MPRPSDAPRRAALALTRFGLGARPGEIDAVASDPEGWLQRQIRPTGAPNPEGALDGTQDRVADFLGYQRAGRERRQARRQNAATAAMASAETMAPAGGSPAETGPAGRENSEAQAAFDARRDSRRALRDEIAGEFLARAQMAASTPDGFAERWAMFWANAFTASATKFQTAVFIGPYEREAIRPHVFGKFADLAVAAERHPAMLTYLDQVQSVGPNSVAGQRREAGLNENLAREILELHTVGADSGYTQTDVTEFARALTGWSIPRAGQGRPVRMAAAGGQAMGSRRAAVLQRVRDGEAAGDGFVFRAAVHEPGGRTVLGQTYAQTGADQGEAILRDLAARPETARRISRNLARHFVADDPPAALVARLETAWTASDGDLSRVAEALIAAPEVWAEAPAKFKTPYEFVVSTHRALGTTPQRAPLLQQALTAMGQPAWAAPSPEGWPDTAADWAGPDALVKRLNWAKAVGDRAVEVDASAVALAALGPRLGERTRLAVARAESRPEALTLFLMSPEFQRR